MERENDPVVQAVLVEDDDHEVFQEPAKKPKTSTKPYVEVPEPSDMNFVLLSEEPSCKLKHHVRLLEDAYNPGARTSYLPCML